jgi:tetratricopeptide (TPR) repeat protein
MRQKNKNVNCHRGSFQTRSIFALGVVVMIVAGGSLYWWSRRPERTADDRLASAFYASLAALDVEENERAQQTLGEAVSNYPDEPSLWANLAIAQFRLRDLHHAEQSVNKAAQLAASDDRIKLVVADYHEQAGDLEAATEQLRELHNKQPKNVVLAYRLFLLLQQTEGENASPEQHTLLDVLHQQAPGNYRVRCEYARVHAAQGDRDAVGKFIESFRGGAAALPEIAKTQLNAVKKAYEAREWQETAIAITFFENVIKPLPVYQTSLAELGVTGASAAGTPLRELVRYHLPMSVEIPPDSDLRFSVEAWPGGVPVASLVHAMKVPDDASMAIVACAKGQLTVNGEIIGTLGESASRSLHRSIAVTDLNFDRFPDIAAVGEDSCRIYLQRDDRTFEEISIANPKGEAQPFSITTCDWDTDGDLDILVCFLDSEPWCLRNNGDATFELIPTFLADKSIREAVACDFDQDIDIDIVTRSANGDLSIWENQRAMEFSRRDIPLKSPAVAVRVADLSNTGHMQVVALHRDGNIRSIDWHGANDVESAVVVPVASVWRDDLGNDRPVELFVADLDNNANLDLVLSGETRTTISYRHPAGDWETTPPLGVQTQEVLDLDGDGWLDLIGKEVDEPRFVKNQGGEYHWLKLSLAAATVEGDRRINAFGLGGRVDVRCGTLVRSYRVNQPELHIGLGSYAKADLIRVYWPNGTVQAEFDTDASTTLVANQRLKGSCPWVFAYDGREFRFVKDFIWRSPLGLRINAQNTAGVVQTEDRMKIPRDACVAREGKYEFRITAELWETHFFDHVGLQVVDHPAGLEMWVDERFVPNQPQSSELYFGQPLHPFARIENDEGVSAAAHLATADGEYEDRFALGNYQGIAAEHWLEFEFPESIDAARQILIVGNGWVYPTDSSLNVAIAQGASAKPFGLVLEQEDSDGNWTMIMDNVGFPAGKMKDCVLPLPKATLEKSRRFRLRTNLEVYWDVLGWTYAESDVPRREVTLVPALAELRYRGYSELKDSSRRRPETPYYRVRTTNPQWFDLTGYYTRFGDIRELLEVIDDRYVIMNAGDEMALEFEVPPKPEPGWQREFVLIGDGWVKDGDLNTVASATVAPWPTHSMSEYRTESIDDHPRMSGQEVHPDWKTYHTRYVTPRHFQRGLWHPDTQDQGTSNEP